MLPLFLFSEKKSGGKRKAQEKKGTMCVDIVLFLSSFWPFSVRKNGSPSFLSKKKVLCFRSFLFRYAAAGFFLPIRYWKAMTPATMIKPAISVQVEGASSSRPPAMARIRVYQGMLV